MIDEAPITVRELIEILAQFPADAVVQADGCDCVEDAYGAYYEETSEGRGLVLVYRKGHGP